MEKQAIQKVSDYKRNNKNVEENASTGRPTEKN